MGARVRALETTDALELHPAFAGEVAEHSRQPLLLCYGCAKCSAGCPTAHVMDFDPAGIVHLVLLGARDALLRSRAIWLCVGCETCGTRCPNGICVGRITDTLKQIALAAGVAPAEPAVYGFHRSFLNSIRRFGRVHEVTMLVEYKLRAGNWLADLQLGARLLRAGKLPLLPRRVPGHRHVANLFGDVAGRSAGEKKA